MTRRGKSKKSTQKTHSTIATARNAEKKMTKFTHAHIVAPGPLAYHPH
jgi:hypothetical protein